MTPRARDASALRRYHELTKHSPTSVATSRHRLDWANLPLPFKIYRELPGVPPPDDIGRLCRLSNGVLRWRRSPRGEMFGFRAAPCTGALYHVELYVATTPRDDLAVGLYHYGAHDHALRLLRAGDVRGALVDAAAAPAISRAPLLAVLTSTFARNAWKYEARAYRHAFWDAGAIVANLLELEAADGVPAAVVMAFDDATVNRLVGGDATHEAALAIVALGDGAPPAPPPNGVLEPLDLATEPVTRREIRYEAIERAHAASSLGADDIAPWRERAGAVRVAVPPRAVATVPDTVIERRRSTRRFDPRPIDRSQLSALVHAATIGIPGDAFDPLPVEPFLIVNAVHGVDPGTYRAEVTPIRRGEFAEVAGALALWQELGSDAAVDVYLLADVDAVLDRLGGRGYRVAQMAGGIAGARVELTATALGLGATGLTFFDDEVTALFEPAARGRQVMYLAAAGRRRRR